MRLVKVFNTTNKSHEGAEKQRKEDICPHRAA